ncbi:MAG: hypothetical protein U5J98_05875 [Halobacteriales archaeon]|nr:hypothetical protein [Halobacteriales archaeon]
MTDNRSLDEFAGADEPEAGEPGEAEAIDPEPAEPDEIRETEPADEPEDEGPDEPVEPMAETVTWSSAGGDCARCGATVEERWRDDDALVCGDCKAW